MKRLIFFLLFIQRPLMASDISFDKVLQSVYQHHPVILQELDKISGAKAMQQEREGQFDLRLKGEYQNRLEGYYDGQYQKFSLEKPVPALNMNIYSAFRKGENSFPVYEDDLNTLENGEVSLGLRLSLLRYREIDQKRLELKNAILNNKNSNLNYEIVKEQLKFYVMQTYVGWYYAGKSVEVYQKLLGFTEQQMKALETRVKRGDLPRIYLVENRQYLLKRKNQLLEAKQKFNKLSFNLSLLWRDEKGSPILPESLPQELPLKEIYSITFDQNEQLDLSKSEMIETLTNELKMINNQILDAQNKLLPKLDLDFKYAKDNGQEDSNLNPAEQKVVLNLEIPLERNLGKGAVAKYRAKRNVYEKKIGFFKEKLNAKFKNLLFLLETTSTMIKNYQDEYQVAGQMQEAEKVKFLSGGSDYFLLNLREQNMATAQINLFKSKMTYASLYAQYLLLKKGIYSEYSL